MTEDDTLKAILDRLVELFTSQTEHEVIEMLHAGADMSECRAHMAARFALFEAWGVRALPQLYRDVNGFTLQ